MRADVRLVLTALRQPPGAWVRSPWPASGMVCVVSHASGGRAATWVNGVRVS